MNEQMKEDIRKACEVLQKGGVILYPTDTIWGIGCDATNEEAVKRVYEIKKRADSKAMLVLVDNAVMMMPVTWLPTCWQRMEVLVFGSLRKSFPSNCVSVSARRLSRLRPM